MTDKERAEKVRELDAELREEHYERHRLALEGRIYNLILAALAVVASVLIVGMVVRG